jgi:hypothetical protein
LVAVQVTQFHSEVQYAWWHAERKNIVFDSLAPAHSALSVDFNVRWIHDFDVSRRVEGDGFNFTASLKF